MYRSVETDICECGRTFGLCVDGQTVTFKKSKKCEWVICYLGFEGYLLFGRWANGCLVKVIGFGGWANNCLVSGWIWGVFIFVWCGETLLGNTCVVLIQKESVCMVITKRERGG